MAKASDSDIKHAKCGANPQLPGFVLPDLCAAPAVLFLTLISLLLALTLVLYSTGLSGFDWLQLGRAALFILWNMLASAALLCALRRHVAQRSVASGAALCFGVILTVCMITSSVAQMVFGGVWDSGPGVFNVSLLARDMLISAMLGGAALRYFHLQGELLQRQRSELDARIQSLQARIRPHFLFNSMNIIASLIAVKPDHAERAVEDLAELFRASLREAQNTVPLVEELDLCERYLRLESLRLGERLQLRRYVEQLPPGIHVPPLCLQPLLENAVYHGVQPLPQGGEVSLHISINSGTLCIEVVNPLPSGVPAVHGGSGIALANIRDRLAAIYGGKASLETRGENGFFHALLRIPCVEAP